MIKIIYHANCTDGSGAALVAWLYYRNKDEFVSYTPMQYGMAPPAVGLEDDLILLDFSFKRDVIVELSRYCNSIRILDHHKTAEEDLKDLPDNVYVTFNMEKSGARLAWEYFFNGEIIPKLILYIEDRDLWKFKYPESQYIHNALGLRRDWKDWEKYLHGVTELVLEGKAIQQYLDAQIEKVIEADPIEFWITNEVVPVYNAMGFVISDLCHAALKKHKKCPYAVCYFHLTDKTVYSLRSRDKSKVDVSEIAKKFGGGGHKHAAGFAIPHNGLNELLN